MDDPRIKAGHSNAHRVADFFGWRVTGYGYPGEDATFCDEKNEYVRLAGSAVVAIVRYLDSRGEPGALIGYKWDIENQPKWWQPPPALPEEST